MAPVPLYDRYVTVFGAVEGTFFWGSLLVEDVTSSVMQTCSITYARYKAMFENYVIPDLQQRNIINEIEWMQRDNFSLIARSAAIEHW